MAFESMFFINDAPLILEVVKIRIDRTMLVEGQRLSLFLTLVTRRY